MLDRLSPISLLSLRGLLSSKVLSLFVANYITHMFIELDEKVELVSYINGESTALDLFLIHELLCARGIFRSVELDKSDTNY